MLVFETGENNVSKTVVLHALNLQTAHTNLIPRHLIHILQIKIVFIVAKALYFNRSTRKKLSEERRENVIQPTYSIDSLRNHEIISALYEYCSIPALQ